LKIISSKIFIYFTALSLICLLSSCSLLFWNHPPNYYLLKNWDKMHNSSFYFDEKVPEDVLHKTNPYVIELKLIDSTGKITKDITKQMDTTEFKNFVLVELKRNVTPHIIAKSINEGLKSHNFMKQNKVTDSINGNTEFIITTKLNDYEITSNLTGTYLKYDATIELYNRLSDDLVYTYKDINSVKLQKNINGMMFKNITIMDLIEMNDNEIRSAIKKATEQVGINFIKNMEDIVKNSNKK
jgi:hypothetical protein